MGGVLRQHRHPEKEEVSMTPSLRLRLNRYIKHRPTPRQAAFLLLPHLEAFYGGAVGGGKSEALLMAALQYVDVPGYHGVIVRDSFAALEEAGALLRRSREWLLPTDATWNATDRVWRFPSGATLSFRPLREDGDERAFMGAEYQFIGIDEVTNVQEGQYRFLLTRLRRLRRSGLPLRMRSTGMPHGPGVEWVRRRFVDGGPASGPIYVPSRLEDNPFLDQEQYEQTLANLDPVARARIRFGDWSVRPEGGMFQASWFDRRFVEGDDLPEHLLLCRYWDLASSEPKKGADPDYTAGVLLGLSEEGEGFVLDVVRAQDTPRGIERLVRRTADRDAAWARQRGYELPAIRMEQEPGSAGVTVIEHYLRQVLGPFDFAGDRPTGSKRTRAAPVASHAEAGLLYIMRGPWNGTFLDELSAFPLGEHDDQVDALSGAHSLLWEAQEEEYIVEYGARVNISPF
jgi:predicted phage terminase large subunit-like protein